MLRIPWEYKLCFETILHLLSVGDSIGDLEEDYHLTISSIEKIIQNTLKYIFLTLLDEPGWWVVRCLLMISDCLMFSKLSLLMVPVVLHCTQFSVGGELSAASLSDLPTTASWQDGQVNRGDDHGEDQGQRLDQCEEAQLLGLQPWRCLRPAETEECGDDRPQVLLTRRWLEISFLLQSEWHRDALRLSMLSSSSRTFLTRESHLLTEGNLVVERLASSEEPLACWKSLCRWISQAKLKTNGDLWCLNVNITDTDRLSFTTCPSWRNWTISASVHKSG